MPGKYSIITLTQETIKSGKTFESGAEQKYKIPWVQVDPDREQLAIFKIDNEPREVSRVWIEKLAGELAISMGLPTATYEMCETEDNRRGIASPSYLKDGRIEQPGIVLMQEVFETNSVLYTVENALTVFDRLDISLPSGYMPPPEISTAKDLFIGYLLHSYWIDDPDFHSRNWGIQINPNGERELLPNYDYGRALVDFPVVNNRLEIFAERLAGTRTCAFVNNDGKEIKMDEMVRILNHISPNITQYWSDRIAQASGEQLNPICDLFPSGWGSPDRIEFARVFINYNSQRLAQLTEASSQIVHEIENPTKIIDDPNPDDLPEPPNDFPDPPRKPPKPPTPPTSPDPANSPDPPNSADSIQSISINIDTPGIADPNIDSQHLTDLQHERQIMTDLEGFHGNAQNQASANARDVSRLAEDIAQGLAGASVDGCFEAFERIKKLFLERQKEQLEALINNSTTAESLPERKENLKKLKQRLDRETREFRRDSRKNAVRIGLNYVLSLFENVKKFLKDTWEAPGKFVRGVKNKFTSLKDFMLQETKGEVQIGQELTGKKQEQAEKFIKLLRTPTGEQAPEGLENTIIAPWGENLIVVDANNNVTANFIQPLMDSEYVQLAMDKNVVAAAVAPNIQPVPNSLASQELDLHGQLIGQDAIDRVLQNIQAPQSSKSTTQDLENIISEPAKIQAPVSIEQPLTLETEHPVVGIENTPQQPLVDVASTPPHTQTPTPVVTQPEEIRTVASDEVINSNKLSAEELIEHPDAVEKTVEVKTAPEQIQAEDLSNNLKDVVPVTIAPKLAKDLVTIAQLHQIGTLSNTSTLLLLTDSEDKAPLSIVHTARTDGSATYEVIDSTKEFNFTVTPEQIVTNFNIRKGNNSAQIRNLVTSIANVLKNPAQTDLKPHPNSDVQRIETVQQLNELLDFTTSEPNLPARSVVTLDSERFGVKLDRANRKVVITHKTTMASMSLGKNGIEDCGLLKKMTEVAKDKSSSLAQRLARVVVEKTNEAKTVLENAPPNIMAALDERATADRATARKVSKAVNRLGTQVDSFIGQGIRNVVATNPAMSGIVRQMKKIEQVGDATENQVSQDLQSAGEHLADSSLVNDGEAQLEPSSIDDREEFQRRLSEAVVHKSPAKTSGQSMQQSC